MVSQFSLKNQKRHSVTAAWFIRILLALGLSLTCSSCAWLDNQQRLLIYRPTAAPASTQVPLPNGDRHYFLDLPGSKPAQRLAFWWMPHTQLNAPTLLYFHGTFRNLEGNLRKVEALRSAGFSVLGVDYRGWGESSPLVPSEKSIMQDAQVAWYELQKLQPMAHLRLIYGHSMGSGVAVDLASRLAASDYAGLVLESAFTSFSEVAHEAGWFTTVLDFFNPERFDSLSKIGQIHAPLLMLHGDQDTTIPMVLGQRLYAAAAQPKQWVTIEGAAHSDLDQVDPERYRAALQHFVASHLSSR
jgi:pimeloyl-ACP methyl ester carboxylesterase